MGPRRYYDVQKGLGTGETNRLFSCGKARKDRSFQNFQLEILERTIFPNLSTAGKAVCFSCEAYDLQMDKLEPRYKKQLCEWIGGRRYFTLLYRATRDGCSAQSFHNLCDNKGPTLTVCYNTAGYVFGGYAAQAWSSAAGTWIRDQHAFLFRLVSLNSFKPKIYPVKQGKESNALVYDCTYGPVFGSDMQLFNGNISLTNNYFNAPGNHVFGADYDTQGDDVNAFRGNNVMYTDIEVYQVTELKGAHQRQAETPWRNIPKDNLKTLMSHIVKYSPPEGSKVDAINLLLLGPVGAGKSSFFNSANSIFQREITAPARSGSAERSLTTTYRRYRVRSSETGEKLKIRLCDTRGLEAEGGLDLVSLMAVVEGHIPDRFEFNPTVPISSKSTGYNSNPSPDDQVHCVAFVIDGTTVDVFPEKIVQVFKSLQLRLNSSGIPQVVIVTKADKICPEVLEDVGQMFSSATIGDLVHQAGQLLGLSGSFVFPVKNYDDEIVLNEGIDIPILLCLKQVLRYADDYIQDSLASD